MIHLIISATICHLQKIMLKIASMKSNLQTTSSLPPAFKPPVVSLQPSKDTFKSYDISYVGVSRLPKTIQSHCWGDLLRSVPCVTVWHWKIKSKILWTREKMIKVHLVYVPRMMKNIMGHLPDLWYNYKTLLKYFGCHTVTFDRSDITKSSLKPI